MESVSISSDDVWSQDRQDGRAVELNGRQHAAPSAAFAAMVAFRNWGFGAALLALSSLECGGKSEHAGGGGASSGSTSGADGGAISTTDLPGAGGSPSVTGGSAGNENAGGQAVGGQAAGGSGTGGSGGSGGPGESGGSGGGGAGEGGSGLSDDDAYLSREGSFKALIFSRTNAWRADSAILSGQQMFEDLAQDYGFEVEMTEETDVFTEVGLREYEVVVFLETSGYVFDAAAKAAFEQWMKQRHGAFVGTLRSADTEFEWEFLDEVRGQNYEGQTTYDVPITIEWNDDSLDFPAVRGLPSPWERTGLWFRLAEYPTWSTKPGFRILGTVDLTWTGNVIVRSAFSYVREHDNFRSFYTGFGHTAEVFNDELVRQHIARGLLWTVRREHWLD